MIKFNGISFFTESEVYSSVSFHRLSESSKRYSREWREDYKRKFSMFDGVKGIQFVYEQFNNGNFSERPAILYKDMVMRIDDTMRKGLFTFSPYIFLDCDASCNKELKKMYNAAPRKVGKPNARKMDEWKEWCMKYLEICEKSKEVNAFMLRESIRKVEGIKGIRKMGERCYRVERENLICDIKVGRFGELDAMTYISMEKRNEIFKDVIEIDNEIFFPKCCGWRRKGVNED